VPAFFPHGIGKCSGSVDLEDLFDAVHANSGAPARYSSISANNSKASAKESWSGWRPLTPERFSP
jgi:hypothetical protein